MTSRPRPGVTSPEAQLLCWSIPGSAIDAAAVTETVKQGIDCALLMRLARRNRMVLCLFDLLNRSGVDVPELAAYRDVSRALAASAAAQLAETRRLLRILGDAGVPVLPYKGAVLDQQLYGGRGLRQAGDIDLLVASDTLPRAQQSLATSGYGLARPLSPRQFRRCVRTAWEMSYARADGGFKVDLHWSLHPHGRRTPLAAASVFQRSGEMDLFDQRVRVLSPEDLLLSLVMHGNRHGWQRLGWVCDIALAFQRYPDMNWDAILSRARIIGATRSLVLAAALTELLLEKSPPGSVLTRLQPSAAVQKLAAEVTGRLFETRRPDLTGWRAVRFQLRTGDDAKRRLGYLARLPLTLVAEDYTVVDLPSPLFPLYYVLRPARLILRALRGEPKL